MYYVFNAYFGKNSKYQVFSDKIYPSTIPSVEEYINRAIFEVDGRRYIFDYTDRYPGKNWDTLNIYIEEGEEKWLVYSEGGTKYCLFCSNKVTYKMDGKWWADLDLIREDMCHLNRLALLEYEEKRKKEQLDLYENYRKLEDRLFNDNSKNQ